MDRIAENAQLDALFETIPREKMRVAVQCFSVQYFVSEEFVMRKTCYRVEWPCAPDDKGGSCADISPLDGGLLRYRRDLEGWVGRV